MRDDAVIKRTVEFIEKNLSEDLTLERIAREAGYSRFHLNRKFSGEMGCTIHKYIQTRRLAEAARKLAHTETPIAEIAFEAHYQSQQAFTNAFSQFYLCSPQRYRQNNRKRARMFCAARMWRRLSA